MDDVENSERPDFTDPLGFSIGESYPDFESRLSEAIHSDVFNFGNHYTSYTYSVQFDKDGNAISVLDPDYAFAVSYIFEGSVDNAKNAVLYYIEWKSKDIKRIVFSNNPNALDPWLDNRVSGTYYGPPIVSY